MMAFMIDGYVRRVEQLYMGLTTDQCDGPHGRRALFNMAKAPSCASRLVLVGAVGIT
jgi:hypothetical protein